MNSLVKAHLFFMLFLLSALATPAQAQKATVTLEGQLVCSDCWSEADRKNTPYGTPADIACARDCAERGIPSAIAVKEGNDYKLYLIEQSELKKKQADWLDRIGGQVQLTGKLYAKNGKPYVTVETYKFLSDAPAAIQTTLGSQIDLNLKDLGGVDQSLTAYKGRIVILNFWATWCVPCKQEMPDLAAIQNEYAAMGVQVIGAAADQISDRAKVLQFMKQSRINFPVWLGATTEDLKRFGVGPGLPATVVIDRDGKIAVLHYKTIQQAQLKKEIDKLLGTDAAVIEQATAASKAATQNVSLVPS